MNRTNNTKSKVEDKDFPTIQECLRLIGLKEVTANVFCVPNSKKSEIRPA
ncbi:hypothetical protein LAG90_15070 [Marinilongibacter aquaticus]|nr:hypothetical protein [Marinilongibacter aquaticus]UBM58126.1 hypothetical protein LAG90_15070 [Marinilongibacter aquaticus]